MLEGKYFINAARGELVDEEYLIEKIGNNHFKGIALDVICTETQRDNNLKALISLTNCHNFILTPHLGGATVKSMMKTEEFIAGRLISHVEDTIKYNP